MSANKYREFADECMALAKTARNEEERATFIEMANTWLQAAVLYERSKRSSGNVATPLLHS
jgi:hypothetical protein